MKNYNITLLKGDGIGGKIWLSDHLYGSAAGRLCH